MTLKHAYVNPVADDGNPNETGPDEWNADHVLDSADTQVLFNDGGTVGGNAGLTFDKATESLAVGGLLAVGTTIDPTALIKAVSTFTSAAAGGSQGLSLTLVDNGAAIDFIEPLSFRGTYSGSGTCQTITGIYGSAENAGSGAVDTLIGLLVGTGGNSGGGTVVNNYGIQIHSQAGVASGQNYNIYSAGNGLNGLNRFDGAVDLGAASDTRGTLRFFHDTSAFATSFRAGEATADADYIWPTAVGAAGSALTDAAGDGTLSWAVPAGTGTVTHTGGALTADALVLGAGADDIKVTTTGTGIVTALGVNVGSAGAPVLFNGALGTPSSGVATNLTGTAAGLTAGVASAVAVGGVTGLGTGVATALAVNVGSAGAPIVNGGALGTPSSGTMTSVTGLTEAGQTLADNTTNNVSTSKHGYAPKAPNDATKYLDGTGAYSVPAGGSSAPSISGIELAFNSTTVLRVKAGTAIVNSTPVAFSQTDYTSGSTMKDIANSTVTLAASKAYWVFLSSAGVIGIEVNDGTGDGATPVFDTTLDYWKAASTGAAWRRIGSFWTNGSSQIMNFYVSSMGRTRKMYLAGTSDCPILVNGVANASVTAVTITPYYTADMAEMLLVLNAVNTSAAAASVGMAVYVDGGTNPFAFIYLNFGGSFTNIQTSYQLTSCPYSGTLHYSTLGTVTNSTIGYIYALGFSQFV